jgi:hypothetical protein
MDMHLALIETASAHPLVSALKDALQRALSECSKLSRDVLMLDGMSGRKYRHFINNLIQSVAEPRYLEIGVWKGSTLCSALYFNDVRALAIDNWTLFGAPSNEFFANLAKHKGPKARLSFLDTDFRDVDFATIGKFNVYFFDGPHNPEDQRDGVLLAQPALDDHFIYIVDDWNWAHVRVSTQEAIREANIQLDFVMEIRTTLDDSQPEIVNQASDWHNGYFIAACSKSRPAP